MWLRGYLSITRKRGDKGERRDGRHEEERYRRKEETEPERKRRKGQRYSRTLRALLLPKILQQYPRNLLPLELTLSHPQRALRS